MPINTALIKVAGDMYKSENPVIDFTGGFADMQLRLTKRQGEINKLVSTYLKDNPTMPSMDLIPDVQIVGGETTTTIGGDITEYAKKSKKISNTSYYNYEDDIKYLGDGTDSEYSWEVDDGQGGTETVTFSFYDTNHDTPERKKWMEMHIAANDITDINAKYGIQGSDFVSDDDFDVTEWKKTKKSELDIEYDVTETTSEGGSFRDVLIEKLTIFQDEYAEAANVVGRLEGTKGQNSKEYRDAVAVMNKITGTFKQIEKDLKHAQEYGTKYWEEWAENLSDLNSTSDTETSYLLGSGEIFASNALEISYDGLTINNPNKKSKNTRLNLSSIGDPYTKNSRAETVHGEINGSIITAFGGDGMSRLYKGELEDWYKSQLDAKLFNSEEITNDDVWEFMVQSDFITGHLLLTQQSLIASAADASDVNTYDEDNSGKIDTYEEILDWMKNERPEELEEEFKNYLYLDQKLKSKVDYESN